MKMNQNPFADYGSIVSGSRFVGRKRELSRLRQRVLPKEGFGNFAIMGLPRIGKSSLMWQGVMIHEKELLEEKTIPVWYTASNTHDTFSFLYRICKMIIKKSHQIADNPLKEFLDERMTELKNVEKDNKEQLKDIINDLLLELKYSEYKIILLIDEFDAVQKYMTEDDFGYLRTISYELDKKICIVTTSRKDIKDIEAIGGAVSNFYGTFDNLRLGVFDEDSLDEYWEWIKNYKPDLKDEYIEEAIYKVGYHPFLLDLYNYCHWNQDCKDVEQSGRNFEIELKDRFETMQNTLIKEKLMSAAIQLIVGPVFDVIEDQTKRLEAYGFIKRIPSEEKRRIIGETYGPCNEDGTSFACFSSYLTNLFTLQHLFDIPYWVEWQETERRIRGVIKKYVNTLGDDWENKLCNRFGTDRDWASNFNALKSLRSRTLKRFTNASSHLVDYTLSSNMFSLFIGPAWGDFFANVFLGSSSGFRSGNREEWRQKFHFLAEIRNPMAHSNGGFVSQEEITQATAYCKVITNAIIQWEERSIHH